MAATVWWWVVPPSEQGDSTRPSNAKLISTPDSGAEYNALVTGGSYNGLARYQGPFTTESAAQAAPANGGNPGLLQEIGAGAGAAAETGSLGGLSPTPQVSNPLDYLQSIGDFFSRLSEANTWIRLAKIVIGTGLIVVGVAHLVGAGKIVEDVAGSVPPVIPV